MKNSSNLIKNYINCLEDRLALKEKCIHKDVTDVIYNEIYCLFKQRINFHVRCRLIFRYGSTNNETIV